MRPAKEIKEALKLLEQLPETPARNAQIDVLRNCHSEKKVFDLYVQKAEVKNESVFYAARDAAQFVARKLELETLLGMDVPPIEDEPEPEDKIVTISKAYLESLEQRLDRLELMLLKMEGIKNLMREKQTERLSASEVCYYIGCSRDTLIRWTKEGLVKAERQGKYYYYPISEMIENDVLRTYIRKKRSRS